MRKWHKRVLKLMILRWVGNCRIELMTKYEKVDLRGKETENMSFLSLNHEWDLVQDEVILGTEFYGLYTTAEGVNIEIWRGELRSENVGWRINYNGQPSTISRLWIVLIVVWELKGGRSVEAEIIKDRDTYRDSK